MKDLVSQDYIDYQDGIDHYEYYGRPVDSLDKACHNHRECLRCAQMELGCASDNISEHYLDFALNAMGYCRDSPGTCQRAYCDCARQFIEDIHDNGIFRYSPKLYSRKYGGFEANEITCKRSELNDKENSDGSFNSRRNKSERRPIACCSSRTKYQSPWRLYNTDKFKCCEDGEVRIKC